MNRPAGLLAAMVAVLLLPGCLQATTILPEEGTDPEAVLRDAPIPTVDVQEFLAGYEAYITKFPDRADNVPTHEGARADMLATFAGHGLTTWRQEFTDGIDQANIIGIKWGQARDQWVVIGAHYDTYHVDCQVDGCVGRHASQGAYDDGSGTAMVLYLAGLYAKLDTPYTLVFALFDGEERGLEGSKHLAATLTQETTPWGNVTVRAMLDADMYGINWPGVQTPIEFGHTSEALRTAVAAAAKELGVPDGMMTYFDAAASGGSDFASFAELAPTGFFSSNMGQEGIPASGAVPVPTPTVRGNYPFWHLADTWQTMTLMAGGPEPLAAGFEVALKLFVASVHAAGGVADAELDHTAA